MNKKMTKLKQEYIEMIKKRGWEAYKKASKPQKKKLDKLYLEWVTKYTPLNLVVFGKEDWPISIKKWFLGLNIFNDELDFTKWAESSGHKIKKQDSEFSVFDIIHESDYNQIKKAK